MQDSSIPIYNVTVGWMDGWMDGPHNKILKPLFPNPFFLSPAPFLSTVIRVFVGRGAGVANIHRASISEIVNST